MEEVLLFGYILILVHFASLNAQQSNNQSLSGILSHHKHYQTEIGFWLSFRFDSLLFGF